MLAGGRREWAIFIAVETAQLLVAALLYPVFLVCGTCILPQASSVSFLQSVILDTCQVSSLQVCSLKTVMGTIITLKVFFCTSFPYNSHTELQFVTGGVFVCG